MRTVLSPALLSPALGDPNDAARKTIISIDNGEGTRYITKADNRVYIIDDNGKTAKAMGHFASDAKIPVVTELLGSTLILSAEDHEALRRMVDKMQGTVSPDADQTRRD